MARPRITQHKNHFTVTIGLVTASYDGNLNDLTIEDRRAYLKEIERLLLDANIELLQAWEGGAK